MVKKKTKEKRLWSGDVHAPKRGGGWKSTKVLLTDAERKRAEKRLKDSK